MRKKFKMDLYPFYLTVTCLITAAAFAYLDQSLKLFSKSRLPLGEKRELIEGYLDWIHTRDFGVFWGIGLDASNLLYPALMTLMCSLLVQSLVVFVQGGKRIKSRDHFLCSFLIGGVLGNFWERMQFGYVTRYLDMRYAQYHLPPLNLSDLLVLLSILVFWYNKFPDLKKLLFFLNIKSSSGLSGFVRSLKNFGSAAFF